MKIGYLNLHGPIFMLSFQIKEKKNLKYSLSLLKIYRIHYYFKKLGINSKIFLFKII